MGFDLYGIKSKNEQEGVYFRNNCWWWRPLEIFIEISCSDFLSSDDIQGLSWNDGYKIGIRKAGKIANRLEGYIGNKKEFLSVLKEVKQRLPDKYYPTTIKGTRDNIKEFIQFCRDSGGFEIC